MAPKKATSSGGAGGGMGTGSKRGPKVKADVTKKTRRKKDPNLPKRAKSAYLYFSIEKRNEVLAEFPQLASKVAEVASILGKRWANASDKEKAKYIALAEADKRRYNSEMADYRNKK